MLDAYAMSDEFVVELRTQKACAANITHHTDPMPTKNMYSACPVHLRNVD
jgi:hypothetical protein